MKFQMHKDSLFAVLLRAPWWVSAAIAAGLFFLARFFLPLVYAAFVPLPFVVIAGVVAWRQLRAPSAGKVAKRLEALRAMPREEFAAKLEEAFRRQGYEVSRVRGQQGDLELVKAGRTSLVDCKRWKATRTGVEPLREFHKAARKREAYECIYVAAGEVTENARAFAAEKNIRLLRDAELAQLLS